MSGPEALTLNAQYDPLAESPGEDTFPLREQMGRAYGAIGRARTKGSEARTALAYVLLAIDHGVSLEALEKALATIKGHLEAAR